MSSTSNSDTATISAGWQSDDEPPQDRPGDLLPLCVKGNERIVALKEITAVGNSFQAAADVDVVDVEVAVPSVAPRFQCALKKIRDQDFVHSVIAMAIQFMKIEESAVLYIYNKYTKSEDALDKPTPKQLRSLQRLRRHFAQANGEGKPWTLAPKTDYTPIGTISLRSVIRRFDFGYGMSKVIVAQGYSWKVPKLSSILHFQIAPLSDSLPLHQAIEITNDLEYKPITIAMKAVSDDQCRACIQSLKVGETCVFEWQSEFHTNELNCTFDIHLEGKRLVLKMLAIEDAIDYYILDPILHSNVLRPVTEIGDGALNILGTVTMTSIHDGEVDEMLRSHDLRGSGCPEDGSLIAATLEAGSESVVLSFCINRSESIYSWLHALAKLMKRGQRYRIGVKFSDQNSRDRACSVAAESKVPKQHLDALRLLKKKSEYCPHVQCMTPQGIKIMELPNGFTAGVLPSLDSTQEFQRLSSLSDWNEFCRKAFGTEEFSLTMTISAEFGQEILAWDGKPMQVWSHVAYLMKQGEQFALQGQLGLAKTFATASEQLLRHLLSRTLDEGSENLNFILEEGYEIPYRHDSSDKIPSILNFAPHFSLEIQAAMFYLCAWTFMKSGNHRKALNYLNKVKLDCLSTSLLLKKRVIELKAITEYQLKLFEECRTTCSLESSPSKSLLGIAKWAKHQVELQTKESKTIFGRMFR